MAHNSLKKEKSIENIMCETNADAQDCSNIEFADLYHNNLANVHDTPDTDAAGAVKKLLSYIGEDPHREGLVETPQRVLRAFAEYFSGYKQDPKDVLNKTFNEISSFDGVICLQDIEFISHCEHHIAPFVGKVAITYYPNGSVVGLSKLARVVDIYAKRLQIQERMTAQIADAIYKCLEPKAVKVVVEASHFCMNYRGANKPSSKMVTTQIMGNSNLFTD